MLQCGCGLTGKEESEMNDRHRASKRAKARLVKKTSTGFGWLVWKASCSVKEAIDTLDKLVAQHEK